jgi:hypothetical protein
MQARDGYGMPADVGGRRRHFQDQEMRKGFVFEEGRVYSADFGNPYLDFNGLFACHPSSLKVLGNG